MNDIVPKPVLFNTWKHHAGFLCEQIQRLSDLRDANQIQSNLKKIGTSTTDLYMGDMGVLEASTFTLNTVDSLGLTAEPDYLNWIRQNHDHFREITFPDASVWILRIGVEPERYIHLHPGRNTSHCRRVKANILKTAIAASIQAISQKSDPFNIDLINSAREEMCNLQPIRFITLNHELGQVIHWFAERLRLL